MRNEYIANWWVKPQLPIRPFAHVSDFVVEEQPKILALPLEDDSFDFTNSDNLYAYLAKEKRSIIEENANRIWENVDESMINTVINSENARLAFVDAKYAATPLWFANIELPLNLANTLSIMSRKFGELKCITYEDCVLLNPAGDMRTFFSTDTQMGEGEYFFFRMHQIIEDILIPVTEIVRVAVKSQNITGEEISKIEEGFAKVQELMVGFRSLNTKDFNVFRHMVSSVKAIGTNGASGSYSGTIPILDLYLFGKDTFEGNRTRYINDNEYFTSFQRKEISDLTNQPPVSILQLKRFGMKNFNQLADILVENLEIFRRRHLGQVKNHLPDVFDDKTKGTMGGDKPGTYLRDAHTHTKKFKK